MSNKLNFLFRLKYGLYINKSPVVVVNFAGCCLHSSYTVCYYLYTQRSRLQIQKQVLKDFFPLSIQFAFDLIALAKLESSSFDLGPIL